MSRAVAILAATRERRRSRRRRVWTSIAAVVATVATIIAIVLLRPVPREIAAVEERAAGLVTALDADGAVKWSVELPRPLLGNHPENWWSDGPQTIVRDEGRPVGVVVATEASVSEPAKLWFLDASDGTTVWVRDASWRAPVNAEGALTYKWNTVVRLRQMAEPVLVVNLNDGDWYSNATRFLRLDGSVLGTYYHPGPLNLADVVEHADGTSSLLLYGMNSSARFVSDVTPFDTPRHCSCVVLLDELAQTGQGYPYSEKMPEPRDWPGMTRAVERAYLLVPMVHPSKSAAIEWLRTTASGKADNRFELYTGDGRLLQLDESLHPSSCYVSVDSDAYRWHQADELFWPPYIHILRGQPALVEVPLVIEE
jgi:hypothetical protein